MAIRVSRTSIDVDGRESVLFTLGSSLNRCPRLVFGRQHWSRASFWCCSDGNPGFRERDQDGIAIMVVL